MRRVRAALVWPEHAVSRTASLLRLYVVEVAEVKGGAGTLDEVDAEVVCTKVWDDGELAGWVDDDLVRVGGILAVWDRLGGIVGSGVGELLASPHCSVAGGERVDSGAAAGGG